MLYLSVIVVIVILYLAFFTPYPFVWFLRSRKGSKRTKSPENIQVYLETITIEKNLKYPSIYPQNTYDVYRPKEGPLKGLVVWLHGGSFIGGTSAGTRNFGPMLASQGYIFCAINYVYAPEKAFPSQLQQTDDAITYLMEKYVGNRKLPLILGGDSAGANIAASYLTFYRQSERLTNMKLVSRHQHIVQSCLLFCGPYDFTEDYTQAAFKTFATFMKYIGWAYFGKRNWWKDSLPYDASPLHHIDENFPRTYLCDGKKASFMWQGKRLVEVLQQFQIECQSRFYETMPHEFQFDYQQYPVEAMAVYQDVVLFLEGGKQDVK